MAETIPKWTVESNNRRMDELEEITEGFLNLMPAHFYLDHSDEFIADDEAENSNKKVKDSSKKETREEKEARWDPLNPQTTMQKVIEHARNQRAANDPSGGKQQNGGAVHTLPRINVNTQRWKSMRHRQARSVSFFLAPSVGWHLRHVHRTIPPSSDQPHRAHLRRTDR